MRKPLIAGNWKMHGTKSQVQSLIQQIQAGLTPELAAEVEVLICPSLAHLGIAQDCLAKPLSLPAALQLGAQNCYLGTQGAFTGEVSAPMLREFGCEWVLLGHSERRHLLHEDLSLIAHKFQAVIDAQLHPILCVGETEFERKNNQTEAVLAQQIESVFHVVTDVDLWANAVIAYEPVWAIGTGLTATPEVAESAHAFIRELIAKKDVDLADSIRILYGGSMKPENAADLLAMPDIDGGLIGGASLNAVQFLAICLAAQQSVKNASLAIGH